MPWTLLAIALLTLPILEIYVIIQVGQVIGALPTIILLVAESALGAWIVKREGRRAWAALTGSFNTGRLPTRELADAALVLVGGTLLLTPGFVTDVAGFFFVLPFTRPLARRGLSWLVTRRVVSGSRRRRSSFGVRHGGDPWGRPRPGPGAGWHSDGGTGHSGDQNPYGGGRVVPGEVVDDDE